MNATKKPSDEKRAQQKDKAEETTFSVFKEKVPGRGFVNFLREQSVVGLAIGLVLGTQAKALVDQMMVSFINPFIGLLLPGKGTLTEKSFVLTIDGKASDPFKWGAFIYGLLTFIAVAALVYYVFKGLRLDKLDKKKDE